MEPPSGISHLLALLDLDEVDRDVFRAANPRSDGRRVFGGQVVAQALRAATLTVTRGHHVHSLHCYFVRPGRPGEPIDCAVERTRDGRSFWTRRVCAVQRGEAILTLEASFHRDELGPELDVAARPRVPLPEALPRSLRHGHRHGHPIDVRDVDVAPGMRRRWVRADGLLPEDPGLHACVLTYASDMGTVGVAAGPRADRVKTMRASLDHCMWFHMPVRADRWLLFDLEAVAATRARGLVRGAFYTEDGKLAISVAQEGLVRPIRSA